MLASNKHSLSDGACWF